LCPNYACKAKKTSSAIIVNHLELFSTIFGAKFVFKLLTKSAKIIIEKGQKSSLFSFYFPIQNLCGILSWSLDKSCRELNSKQLSFLGHFQKKVILLLKMVFEI
jgi:hypothetical protein